MKFKSLTAIALCAMAILACNDDALTIGSTLTSDTDKPNISTGIFNATSRSVLADSVYARNFNCYLGLVKDPETETYIRTDFMAQFNLVENSHVPAKQTIVSTYEGDVAADSCEIWLYFNKNLCYGDSLTPVKINMREMKEPMDDTRKYYSNYDPIEDGYVDMNGYCKSMAFTLANLTYSESVRKGKNYTDYARISMSDGYTDKDGITYNNYGTYLMRTYFAHPEYFKNSYSYTHNVCPGFYFEVADGLGVMANIDRIDLRVYYRYLKNGKETADSLISSSTPEVLQTTRVINDPDALDFLVNFDQCTYMKTPAGIFTEVTLPVEEIMSSHAKDSLLLASIAFQRLNSEESNNPYLLPPPKNILMVMKDSVHTFFEKERLANSTTTFLATLTKNQYPFNNIGNLISRMAKNRENGIKSDPKWTVNNPNWNKVLLVPITTTASTTTTSKTSTITSISNNMSLTSTQLAGGSSGEKIELKIIYASFKDSK